MRNLVVDKLEPKSYDGTHNAKLLKLGCWIIIGTYEWKFKWGQGECHRNVLDRYYKYLVEKLSRVLRMQSNYR